MSHLHLTVEDREVIAQMQYAHATQREIAARLGRHPGTISRELRRNRTSRGYTAISAQRKAERRRRERPIGRKMDDPHLNQVVRSGLTQEWSPEEISGRLVQEHPDDPTRRISVQTIYRWLEKCEFREHFRSFLRHGRYRRRGRNAKGRTRIPNRVDISERPAEANERTRLGDWEGDTVIGAQHAGALVTYVDRRSGYLLAAKMNDRRVRTVNRATERVFAAIPSDRRHTLTLDNGLEFAGHERLSRRLGLGVYFARPYCSQDRGTNENTNGLLRQYFPKGTSFHEVSHSELASAVEKLNNRPRKRLGYLTPTEVFWQSPNCA